MNLEDIKINPVLLHFTATWCGPCRAMEPTMEYIRNTYSKVLAYEKIDIDKLPDMATAHNVRSVPTFIVLKNVKGEWVEVDRTVGGRSAINMETWIGQCLHRAEEPETI